MKRGDPRVIGPVAYATPLLSTLLLFVVTQRPPTATLRVATLLIVSAAAMAVTASRGAQAPRNP